MFPKYTSLRRRSAGVHQPQNSFDSPSTLLTLQPALLTLTRPELQVNLDPTVCLAHPNQT